MQPQLYTDPGTGRQYYVDANGQSHWADQAPATAPAAPIAAPMPIAPMPGQPMIDPASLGPNAAQAMGVAPVTPGGGMANIQLGAYDFTQVQSKNIMVLDPNVSYEFAVADVKGKKSSTGEDMIEVWLEVCWPEKLPNGEDCKGASVIDNITMSPNALWKAKAFLSACEMLGPNGRFTGTSLEDLKGCVVRANVRNEVWNEQTRSKIAGGYKPGFETPGMKVTQAPAAPGGYPAPVAPASPMPMAPMAPQVAPQAAPPQAPMPQAPNGPMPAPMAPQPQFPVQPAAPSPMPQPPMPAAPPAAPQ